MNISYENAKKLFDDDPQKVIDSIWESHWRNAKNINDITGLNNLLSNHKRLLNECPERNNGSNRQDIIRFIENKIQEVTQ
jgi:hypothetical protein